jgi:hypothetical protein
VSIINRRYIYIIYIIIYIIYHIKFGTYVAVAFISFFHIWSTVLLEKLTG